MKKKLVIIGAVVAALFFVTVEGITTIAVKNAECRYCPTYTCYGPCGGGCVCVTPPGKIGGKCYGVDYKEHFEGLGYKVQ